MRPGVHTRIDSLAYRPLLHISEGRPRVTVVTRTVSGASRDAGNSPTSVIRGGMLMGKITASGKLVPMDLALSNGAEAFYCVLPDDLRVTDPVTGADLDQTDMPVYVSADIKAGLLLYKGLPLVGHASEATIRTAMRAKMFIFDDE